VLQGENLDSGLIVAGSESDELAARRKSRGA